MDNKGSKVREKILETALKLFNQNGVQATGIDLIISESGVAKRSFYNHFPSKNKLIEEYFNSKDVQWFMRLEHFSSKTKNPKKNLLGLFDALEDWFSEKDFNGCPFIRGLYDLEAVSTDPHIVNCIEAHFKKTAQLVENLLKEAYPKNYRNLVPQILSLLTGATVLAQATGSVESAKINKRMAEILMSKW